MYLVVSTNVDDVTALLEAEFERLEELRADGLLTAAWVKPDYSGAVLVLDCRDDAEVGSTLASFPMAVAGATTFVTTPIVELGSARSRTS